MGFEPPVVALNVAQSDITRLPENLAIADADFDWIHFDVADGSFVPRMTFGPPVLALARRWTHATFDAHLLMARPARIVGALAAAGAGVITLHAAACEAPRDVLRAIREKGVRAGLAICPQTNLDSVRPLLSEVDVVNVLTSNIEFESGEFQSAMIARVRTVREHREREKLHFLIEVEGGLDLPAVSAVREAGADVFVVGAPVFAAGDPAYSLATFRAVVRGRTLEASLDGVTTEPKSPPAAPRVFGRRRAT